MSFGKKDRNRFSDQTLFEGEMDHIEQYRNGGSRINGDGLREEFSDESLFGEDRIEDLIERKHQSFSKGHGLGMTESFRSRGGPFGINMIRTSEEVMSHSN
jgi:hypothetical protein